MPEAIVVPALLLYSNQRSHGSASVTAGDLLELLLPAVDTTDPSLISEDPLEAEETASSRSLAEVPV
ncbi:hypothetical protein WJX72_008126 [[Myrmecia] bisecta]|uniref:Uncharacterized protein n=1 Tax=[Myrmecia] bisecta TaxID=41462 RepID=A0AAW1R7R9_9CHLO